ncbi:hypothetical protein OENI_200015 [Oenococcus oeni]|nr:hypothetical protein OENI_200015 [Oenococcus oeni]
MGIYIFFSTYYYNFNIILSSILAFSKLVTYILPSRTSKSLSIIFSKIFL